MSGGVALTSEPAPVLACTISRDVQNFDLLIDDMEAELGEGWGDLNFHEALAYLSQPEARDLEFVAIAADESDEDNLTLIGSIITAYKEKGIKIIIIAEDVSPQGIHRLLKLGADDFVPYPLPDGALHDAILRARTPDPAAPAAEAAATQVAPRMGGAGALFAVQGMAGGVGATTLAVNLAWELAITDKKKAPSVCLVDLDLQFGAASTYLDLPRRDVITELLTDSDTLDEESFRAALATHDKKLNVFTAPAEIVPLEMITPTDVERLIAQARAAADIVIIDMPSTVTQWTETVLKHADVYFAPMELDMRSAQNALRFIKALRSEDLPLDKVHFVVNRGPGFTDLSGKGRIKRMAESLSIKLETVLPDGGKIVREAEDHGAPLASMAAKNPLRREIAKLAKSLFDAMLAESAAAG